MFNGFIRFVIFCTTLFVAWLATGRLLAATHPTDLQWLGYVQATGVELVLGYCVWLVARTTEKGIVGMMIVFFGLFSISAQVLHAQFFGVPLPHEADIPTVLVWAWKYALPAVPTLAGISVGLLELAETRRVPEGLGLREQIDRFMNQFSAPPAKARRSMPAKNGNGEAHAYAMDVERLPFEERPLAPRRRRKK